MSEYKVEIHETSSRIITVSAKDEDDAVDRVSQRYSDGEYILDSSDFQDVSFEVI